MLRKPEPIIPILKEIVSPDVDLLCYEPEDVCNFGIAVECVIGAESRKGGDLFQLTSVFQHGSRISAAATRPYEEMLRDSSATDWEMTAARIGRYMEWKFEDHKE